MFNGIERGSPLWRRLRAYLLLKEECRAQCHKRSDVETTSAMMEGKFEGSVRSKTAAGEGQEDHAEVPVPQIGALVRAMHEVGMAPSFGRN